jgi:AcrR family transcriptional regulator
MSAAADTPSSAPPTETARGGRSGRALHQRQRILDAAERCFIDSGFHAATMDHIARTVGVGPGLIYRYFDSKSAIVRAIIERHLENDGGCRIVDEDEQSQPLCDRLLDVFECWRRGADPKLSAALMLELTAESTRNVELAEFIRGQDRMVGKRLAARVRREARARGTELTAADAQGRAVILQCLVEGLACRAVRDPTVRRATLRPALEQVIAALMR